MPPVADRRQYPRARSGLSVLSPEAVELVDIAPYGARIRLPEGSADEIRIALQAQARPLRGEAVGRVAERRGTEARLIFEHIDTPLQQEILRVARAQLFCDGIGESYRRGASGDAGFRRCREPGALLARMADTGAVLTLSVLHRGRPLSGPLHTTDDGLLGLSVPADLCDGAVLWGCAVVDHESVLLQVTVVCGADGLALRPDPAVLLTDRRSSPRHRLAEGEGWVDLGAHRLPVTDCSARGIGLRVPAADLLPVGRPRAAVLHRAGHPLRAVTLLPRNHRSDADGVIVGAVVLDGAALDAARPPIIEERWSADEVAVRRCAGGTPAARIRLGSPSRPIAGLWTEVRHPGAQTLVVIPPAWGRTKESSALLAQVLAGSFDAAGRHIAVLRIDYAETIGESHRSRQRGAGQEALDLSVTGCVADIRAAINGGLSRLDAPEQVVLLGMSFSGPLCLRAAATEPRVTHLVQLMGASDIQDLVRCATGGVDYVARYQAGIHSGLQNVLGMLSDPDRWCPDGLRAGLLQLADAQADAARLRVPLLWICGEHDAFVSRQRVDGVLAAAGSRHRQLAVVPCGHVPSQTGEAVIAAAPLVRFLLGQAARGVCITLPEEAPLEAIRRAEWAAAPRQKLASPRDYWRSYMLGETDDALGFDVLTLTGEYQEMMAQQVALLDLSPGQSVHDLGGGPGHALPHLAAAGPGAVYLYDLVGSVLDGARDRAAGLPLALHTRTWDAATEAIPETLIGSERVLMSLFLSVLPDPLGFLGRLSAVLAPGAVVVASSICPDADLSVIYTRLMADVSSGAIPPPVGHDAQSLVAAIRAYVSSAAWLLRLAEEGTFRLLTPAELSALFTAAGFDVDAIRPAFGTPARAVIVRAIQPGG